MIALLRGIVHSRIDEKIVLMVRGVGYDVTCTRTALERLSTGGEVDLPVITAVSENAIELYGFDDATEKQLFSKLITVSGIGPKAALALLSTFGARTLVGHIYSGNEKAITKAPGIGKRSAQRLIVDLSGAMEEFRNRFSRPMETVSLLERKSGILNQGMSALMNLGFRSSEVDAISRELEKEAQAGADLSTLVKKGLTLLRKER
ncbi:Holliday junction branch migration protein RuvA [Myxococcota bacterium]|nr:Holliday junction branch migration protein RuvA [Myxococcota bacterium]